MNHHTTELHRSPLTTDPDSHVARPPDHPKNPSIDIDLFGGAGGLSIGLTSASLPPDHIYEIDSICCETLRHNSRASKPRITADVHREDVVTTDWSCFSHPVRLLAAGPPCQPFSNGGKHLADRDTRNLFPATLNAIRQLRPAVVLLENVPGLTRPSFKPYFNYLTRQLRFPSVTPGQNEDWQTHDARLLQHLQDRPHHHEYSVCHWLLNAADYGVAQARLRLFIVAVRSDLRPVSEPPPTHSKAALMHQQETGRYWLNRDLHVVDRTDWPRRINSPNLNSSRNLLPWVTVRDALDGLPDPTDDDDHRNNHWLIPGARTYPGHTGSELDWPAKTIKAGVHGVSGGENVVVHDDGTHRYFTLREMACLQAFPDDYFFVGPRSRVIAQIGNAVPCLLAQAIGERIGSAWCTESLPSHQGGL